MDFHCSSIGKCINPKEVVEHVRKECQFITSISCMRPKNNDIENLPYSCLVPCFDQISWLSAWNFNCWLDKSQRLVVCRFRMKIKTTNIERLRTNRKHILYTFAITIFRRGLQLNEALYCIVWINNACWFIFIHHHFDWQTCIRVAANGFWFDFVRKLTRRNCDTQSNQCYFPAARWTLPSSDCFFIFFCCVKNDCVHL